MKKKAKTSRKAMDAKMLKRAWRRETASFVFSIIKRIFLFILIVLVLLVHRMFLGPSQTVSSMLTMTLLETSAMKFVPRLFMREEAVQKIQDASKLVEPESAVDTSLIRIASIARPASDDEQNGAEIVFEEPIEIIPVTGSTYKGHLMIVKDPSRIFLGVTKDDFSTHGMRIEELVAKYDAVGGINASGFYDENGRGNGGSPIGMVISGGKILRKGDNSTTIAAFDDNNILHIGKFTAEEATELHLRDGAGWGPALIINGEPAEVGSNKTGLNPRTAIAQRADGAILMLVIDGRHPNSMGATYSDMIEILMRYGAVNACNLDGGTSSIMYYEGKRITHIENLSVARSIPTAFLIRQEAD